MKHNKLLSPITINGMELKNRFCMPAISLVYCPDGEINDKITQFYLARAKGGVGLITVGGCAIDHIGHSFAMVKLSEDKYIDGLKKFTDELHAAGAKVGAQLFQNGRYARATVTGNPVLGPSAVFSKYSNEMPREMTTEEIKETVNNFALAAARAKKAGFDMVEILASAGYLICQFLSPLTNQREDEYGGSWENRCRFPKEVVEAIRKEVGPNYPIFVRLTGNDFVDGSNTNVEAVEVGKLLEQWGVDAINVTGGWHEAQVPQITGHVPESGYAYLAAAIKKAVNIPVFLSNRMVNMDLAERLLMMNVIDGVNMARPLICDPEIPNKVKAGKIALICRCIACEQRCMDNSFKGKSLGCAINPFAGEEYHKKLELTKKAKKVLVVGGGPGGMQAAVIARKRGHDVTLWEKQEILGGQINYASKASGKQDFDNLTSYLKEEMREVGVKVELRKEATAEKVLSENFDVAIIATGATPKVLNLPNEGFQGTIAKANDVLSGEIVAGKDVVVVGGGAVGCEAAVFMSEEGTISAEEVRFLMFHNAEKDEKIRGLMKKSNRNVTIIEMLPKIGKDIGPGSRWVVMKEIREYGIKKYTEAKTIALTKKGIRIALADGSETEIEADTIVYSIGSNPINDLEKQLKDKMEQVFLIGDAQAPRHIPDAIFEATDVAMNI